MSILLTALHSYASAQRKKANEWFFKTGRGQYGEGDKFIGVSNPDVRKVVSQFRHISLQDIAQALNSDIHEERLAGLLILVHQYAQAKTKDSKQRIATFYLRHILRVNNWDLVDLSASRILGQAILDGVIPESTLDRLAGAQNMWKRRVAIIATMAFIRDKQYAATLRIATQLLSDPEDLTHKAVGWALREVWKKDPKLCEQFLLTHYTALPRTTLRYAIERMVESKRQAFLKRRVRV